LYFSPSLADSDGNFIGHNILFHQFALRNLNNIRIILLHPSEVKHPGKKQYSSHSNGGKDYATWHWTTQQRPPESFDHANHRAQTVQYIFSRI
jgi:hypothetical protein